MVARVLACLLGHEPVLVAQAASIGEVLALSCFFIIEPALKLSLTRPTIKRLFTNRETVGLNTCFFTISPLHEPVRVAKTPSIAETVTLLVLVIIVPALIIPCTDSLYPR